MSLGPASYRSPGQFSTAQSCLPGACFPQTVALTQVVCRALQKMMIAMAIKVTPTFMLYRNGEVIHTVSGINETNLRTAVEEH